MAGNIITRVGKGSQLSFVELDNNFKVIAAAINAVAPNSITIDGAVNPVPVPTIVFSSPTVTVAEGNSGLQTVPNTINIVRNGLTGDVTVALAYSGTATAGTDYGAIPTSVTILGGANSATFSTTINSDTLIEGDETIVITASLSGYSATATKTITITNDDAAVNTPVTSNKTSGWTSGQNPPDWDTAYDGIYYDSSDGTGDKLRLIWRLGGSGAFTTTAWTPFDFSLVDPVEGGFIGVYPFLSDGTLDAGGLFEVRVQAGRDVGLSSQVIGAESNTFSDTLNPKSEAATYWTSTNGQGKFQDVNVSSGTPLVARGTDGYNNYPIFVRATQNRTGKRQFQVTETTATGYRTYIGLDDGTAALSTPNVVPGKNNTKGLMLRMTGGGDFVIFGNGGELYRDDTGTAASILTNGTVITMKFDTAAGTAQFFTTKSGTTVAIGPVVTIPVLSAWYPVVGFEASDTLTAKFNTGQSRPLDTGYNYYDK